MIINSFRYDIMIYKGYIMKEKKIIINLTKDTDISKAVSKALNVNYKKNYKTIKASQKQENDIQNGKFTSTIGEFRGVAG